MPLPLAIPLAVGIGGAIGKMFGRGKANRRMDALLKEDPKYKANPLAQERLNLTRTLLNARMPGSAQLERNIFTNQANATSNVMKNATDSSQALALASGIYGNTANQLTDLGVMEAQDYSRRQNDLFGAQEGMINEQDKVYQDELRRYQNKFDVEGAKNQNRQNNWGDVSNLGFSMANFGLSGGFDKIFGGGGGGSQFQLPGRANVAMSTVQRGIPQLGNTLMLRR